MLVTGQPERPGPEKKGAGDEADDDDGPYRGGADGGPLGVAFATSEPISRFVGTSGNDSIRETAGDDVLEGRSGDDALDGMGGHDFLYGQYGHDGLYEGSGDDVIHGGKGDNRTEERAVHGGSGRDVLYGEGGADALCGGPGNDIVLSTYDDAGDTWTAAAVWTPSRRWGLPTLTSTALSTA
jgi:Ca2+-binding RTX toxin-like protein